MLREIDFLFERSCW